MVKRIVDGVTFNTETSWLRAIARWEDHDHKMQEQTLYETKGGAFWLLCSETSPPYRNPETAEWVQPKPMIEVEPMSREETLGWMMHGQVEVIHNPFDDPPEAVAEEAPAATVYMRVPATLKDALEKAAKSDGVSVNAWMMRCAGSCLKIRGGTATNVVQPDAIAPIVRGRGKRKRTRGQGAPSSG